ncbi:hypothetical protein GCK32_010772 [Trichostrongylus colubriformis]|uniref:ShKT domain-containing protein n=1 Tax=Trichostrongylus colubriformis TaxID=6319 RepID=A0AAN8FPK6_TRICO
MIFRLICTLVLVNALIPTTRKPRIFRTCKDRYPEARCLKHKEVGDCEYKESWQYLIKKMCAKTCGFCKKIRAKLRYLKSKGFSNNAIRALRNLLLSSNISRLSRDGIAV